MSQRLAIKRSDDPRDVGFADAVLTERDTPDVAWGILYRDWFAARPTGYSGLWKVFVFDQAVYRQHYGVIASVLDYFGHADDVDLPDYNAVEPPNA